MTTNYAPTGATEADYQRLMKHVTIDPESGCWHSSLGINSDGYSTISISGKTKKSHRVSYERNVGSLNGLPADHTCHVAGVCNPEDPADCPHRRCVNPDHIVPTPHGDNIRRGNGLAAINAAKTVCDNGHPLTPENVYTAGQSGRKCKVCHAYRMADYQRRKKLARAAKKV